MAFVKVILICEYLMFIINMGRESLVLQNKQKNIFIKNVYNANLFNLL